jgi:hypothetical protein
MIRKDIPHSVFCAFMREVSAYAAGGSFRFQESLNSDVYGDVLGAADFPQIDKSLKRVFLLGPGGEIPPHDHVNIDERFEIGPQFDDDGNSGDARLLLLLEMQDMELSEGGIYHAKPGIVHGFFSEVGYSIVRVPKLLNFSAKDVRSRPELRRRRVPVGTGPGAWHPGD